MRSRILTVTWMSILVVTLLMPAAALRAAATAPGNTYFARTWARTDQPVTSGEAVRTWMWGPEAFSRVGIEEYAQGPDGWRVVQYFDKSRMEITSPFGDSSSPWFVTNGLLVVEMVTGRLQMGDATIVAHPRGPAVVNVAGDGDDPTGPTYATFTGLSFPGYTVGSAAGAQARTRIDRAGMVHDDPALASRGVSLVYYDTVTRHNIAGPFWTFMNSRGIVSVDGSSVEGSLFENPFYATGRPITEPYWASVKVAETYRDVLMQCFERRCLTYTPDNPAGWQVEAGNVGLHYYAWRYMLDTGIGPAAGLINYWSNFSDPWAQWPTGDVVSGDARWLGGPNGTAAITGDEYQLTVTGGVNAWVGVTAPVGEFGDSVALVDVRMPAGIADPGDRGCLLSRVRQDGADLRLYALCIRANMDFIAFYYERVGGVEAIEWFVPPGAAPAVNDADHHLLIVAIGPELWFHGDGHLLAHATHNGPRTGVVAAAVQRGTAGVATTGFWFQNLTIVAAHMR